MKHFRQKPSARKAAGPVARQLILGYETARLVVHGQRQVHILPVRSSDHRKRFLEGNQLLVKGYVGGPTEARVVIGNAYRLPLGGIDFQTARAFGAVNVDAFRIGWVDGHDSPWVVKLADPDEDYPSAQLERAAAMLERFESRWSARDVWVVWFELDRTQPPRLLAGGVGGGGSFSTGSDGRWVHRERAEDREEDRGYTSTAARGLHEEMPVLTDEEWDTHISSKSSFRRAELIRERQAERRARDWQQRYESAKREAKGKGSDIRDECRRFDRLMERGLAEKAMKQLDLIEARVYPIAA